MSYSNDSGMLIVHCVKINKVFILCLQHAAWWVHCLVPSSCIARHSENSSPYPHHLWFYRLLSQPSSVIFFFLPDWRDLSFSVPPPTKTVLYPMIISVPPLLVIFLILLSPSWDRVVRSTNSLEKLSASWIYIVHNDILCFVFNSFHHDFFFFFAVLSGDFPSSNILNPIPCNVSNVSWVVTACSGPISN